MRVCLHPLRRLALLAVWLFIILGLGSALASPALGSEIVAAQWRPAGSLPLDDATAAARVRPTRENRPGNEIANRYRPTDAELSRFRRSTYEAGGAVGQEIVQWNPLTRYVTGGYAGTTDEILQWAAHKWGIPGDVLRSVAAAESGWRQETLGDRVDGVPAVSYPARSRIDADSVYESLGLMQIKWRWDESLHVGTEPLRWRSTAFNVDYWAASVRFFYDGYCNWCAPAYGPGDEWGSVGGWYSPSPWDNAGKDAYISRVRRHLSERTWESPEFGSAPPATTPAPTPPPAGSNHAPTTQLASPPGTTPPHPQVAETGVSGRVLQPAKLEVARSGVLADEGKLDVLAPITRRASGAVTVDLHAAGRRTRFDAPIDQEAGHVRFRRQLSATQAAMGTGIVTLTYPGNDRTRAQEVRLRAASGRARLQLDRPTLRDGRLRAEGTISARARGAVRVQLSWATAGEDRSIELHARIRDGRWSLDEALSTDVRQAIAHRSGTVHSYTLFTGYLPARMRGEMHAYQVLGAP